MSTAWASGIGAVHAFQIALMEKQAQDDVWGDSIHTRVSSAYAPLGKVEVVDGGFKLSGRWGWSSGSEHCTWALLGAIVPGEGYRTFLVPKGDYVIEDTWFPMGLHGTGSQDIVIDGCFVPEHRTHKQLDGFNLTNPGAKVNTASLYQIPWAQIFVRVVSTPAIGACKDALRLYQDFANSKASMDPSKHAQDSATLERIAFAANTINEMEAVMFANFATMEHAADNGESEFKATGLTPEYHEGFIAPFVGESQLAMGLELQEILPIAANGCDFIIAKILWVKLPEQALLKCGNIDLNAIKTVAVSGLDTYYLPKKLARLAYAKPDKKAQVLND